MSDALITYVKKLFEKDKNFYKGIEFNSVNVRPGTIFFALKGEKNHGAQFAPDAVARGARAVVVDDEGKSLLPEKLDADIIPVENTIKALQDLAAYYRSLFKGKVVGITGSAGKTTVKEMIVAVLSERFTVEFTRGNFNNHIGLPYSILNSSLQADYYVYEIGTNHPGEIQELASVMKPDWSLVTNIGTAHIGFFGSQEAIAREKMDIFFNTDEAGLIFINMMDPYLKNTQINRQKIRVALDEDQVDYSLYVKDFASDGTVVLESREGIKIKLPIPGIHQATNALFAYAVGREAGLNDVEIARALQSMKSMDKRMEVVTEKPFLVINDAYNANRESVLAAIEFLEKLEAERKIIVLGDIFELGDQSEKIHLELGHRLQQTTFSHIYLIGKETGVIAKELKDPRIKHFSSQDNLVQELEHTVREGDAVLFKASRGMALEKIIEQWIGKEHAS